MHRGSPCERRSQQSSLPLRLNAAADIIRGPPPVLAAVVTLTEDNDDGTGYSGGVAYDAGRSNARREANQVCSCLCHMTQNFVVELSLA